MKPAITAGLLLLVAAPVTAQPAGSSVDPGFITPDTPLYGLELAIDNIAMTVGLTSSGAIAKERAAEARVMAQKKNYAAMDRAVDNLNAVTERDAGTNSTGVETAVSVLTTVQNSTPESAQQGLDTAIQNLRGTTAEENQTGADAEGPVGPPPTPAEAPNQSG